MNVLGTSQRIPPFAPFSRGTPPASGCSPGTPAGREALVCAGRLCSDRAGPRVSLQPARSGRAGRGLRRCVPPEGALSGLAEAADWRAHASAAQDGAVGCGHACLCGPLLRRSLGTHSGRTRHVLGSRDGRRARGAVGKATGFLPGPHRGLRFSASLPCTCCPLGLFWKVLPPQGEGGQPTPAPRSLESGRLLATQTLSRRQASAQPPSSWSRQVQCSSQGHHDGRALGQPRGVETCQVVAASQRVLSQARGPDTAPPLPTPQPLHSLMAWSRLPRTCPSEDS